jgi:hypothetical protein
MTLSRREMLRATGLGLVGYSMSGWLPALAAEAAADPARKRHCVLLWMTGGPTQTDTFDMKPDHENGGGTKGFKEVETSVPGLRFSEHLPKLAKQADQLAILRGLSTKEGDHGRGTFLMRTGHQPTGPIRYPTLGSTLSKELGNQEAEVPNFVSISPYRAFNQAAYGPGFLGPKYAPLTVGATNNFQQAQANPNDNSYAVLGVDDLAAPASVSAEQIDGRIELWKTLQNDFLSRRRAASPIAHDTVYQRAVRMMKSEAAKAFDLSQETEKVRDAYGRGRFGQGCLMARRLIEKGVAFVEVSLGGFGNGGLGWDTHNNNFAQVKGLSTELDNGWGTLMSELAERGLLESTTIVWMGEFGRTPKINQSGGRDHYPNAWTAVLAGGGIKGGQAHGKTGPDGMTVEDGKIDVGNVLATLATALGVDPKKQNVSEVGRPFRIAEGDPIKEVLS